MSIDYSSDWIDPEIRHLALQAPKSELARSVASRAGLPLDGDPLATGRGTILYVNRLVLLGLDTPENLLALFGAEVDAPKSELRRDFLIARLKMQFFVKSNGEDASQMPGYLKVGIPSGEKINVRAMSKEEQDDARKLMRTPKY